MPIAGHPTVGTAFLLATKEILPITTVDGSITWNFEENIGTIPMHVLIKQGQDMGRPSEITITITQENRAITQVAIAGQAVIVSHGKLLMDELLK